jgi:hypothetical protein
MHPYKLLPPISFWSDSVTRNYRPEDVLTAPGPLIRTGEKVMSAGSCFAANLRPFLERAGLTYVTTEAPHPYFADLPPERFGYGVFSAAYGNIYTPRQLLQILLRAVDEFRPIEDRWITTRAVVDPFRPGLLRHALSEREFDLLTAQHLRATRKAFKVADVFIFTLGLTQGWASTQDGAVFPACPGTVAGEFDPAKHTFVNFGIDEARADLNAFVARLRILNPAVRIILTVSPVPLVATATGEHVLAATTYSKSVLRVAAAETARAWPNVAYFPAYEIVTGPQAPHDFFSADRRSVSAEGVQTVMSAFLAHCEVGATPAPTPAAPSLSNARAELSVRMMEAECEEEMAAR